MTGYWNKTTSSKLSEAVSVELIRVQNQIQIKSINLKTIPILSPMNIVKALQHQYGMDVLPHDEKNEHGYLSIS